MTSKVNAFAVGLSILSVLAPIHAGADVPGNTCKGEADVEYGKVEITAGKSILIYTSQGNFLRSIKVSSPMSQPAFGLTQTNHILVNHAAFGVSEDEAGGSCVLLQNMNVKFGKTCPVQMASATSAASIDQPNRTVGSNQFGAVMCANPKDKE